MKLDKRIIAFIISLIIVLRSLLMCTLVSADDISTVSSIDITVQRYYKNATYYKSNSAEFDDTIIKVMSYLETNTKFDSQNIAVTILYADNRYHLFINNMIQAKSYNFLYESSVYPCYLAYDPSTREYYDSYISFINVDESSIANTLINHDFTESVKVNSVTYMPLLSSDCVAVTNLVTPQNINTIPVYNNQFYTYESTECFFMVKGYKDSPNDSLFEDRPVRAIYKNVDVQNFTEWIIKNERYKDILACGLNIANDKLEYLVSWWTRYSGSISSILIGMPSLISNINVLAIDYSVISSVCNCLDNLYIEYKNYVSLQEKQKYDYDHSYWPGHIKDNNDDDINDNDYTYVTDTEDDDIYTSILREILRTIIIIPQQIRVQFNDFDTYFDTLLMNITSVIYYIEDLPNSIAYNINTLLNLDALELNVDNINLICNEISLKISDLIDIFDVFPDIPQNIIDDYIDNIDVLYEVEPENNPIVEFEDKITEKFPIIEQSQHIVSIENFISEENKTPVITMKNPALLFDSDKSNDILLADSNNTSNDITVFDFSKFDGVLEVFKNVLAFFIILGFGHWLINYIPKLLAGYNESD